MSWNCQNVSPISPINLPFSSSHFYRFGRNDSIIAMAAEQELSQHRPLLHWTLRRTGSLVLPSDNSLFSMMNLKPSTISALLLILPCITWQGIAIKVHINFELIGHLMRRAFMQRYMMTHLDKFIPGIEPTALGVGSWHSSCFPGQDQNIPGVFHKHGLKVWEPRYKDIKSSKDWC